jgi:SsrA-binding protein
MKPPDTTLIASNRKARHDFTILDTVEAGMVLRGSEVKSMREGLVQLADAYARIQNGECWMDGVHIAPYGRAHGFGAHIPDRDRKLLLNRSELDRLNSRMMQERLTLVPLQMYFRDGRAKVELGLAKGRQKADKRHAIAERDAKEEAARAMGRQRRGSDW